MMLTMAFICGADTHAAPSEKHEERSLLHFAAESEQEQSRAAALVVPNGRLGGSAGNRGLESNMAGAAGQATCLEFPSYRDPCVPIRYAIWLFPLVSCSTPGFNWAYQLLCSSVASYYCRIAAEFREFIVYPWLGQCLSVLQRVLSGPVSRSTWRVLAFGLEKAADLVRCNKLRLPCCRQLTAEVAAILVLYAVMLSDVPGTTIIGGPICFVLASSVATSLD